MAKFCENCGKEINENQDICLGCGKAVKKENNQVVGQKSKVAAALLAFFLGCFGAHNFYLGHTGKAVAQLLLTIFGYILTVVIIGAFMIIAVGIWAFVEFILILTGSIKDAKGNALK